jgi:hypothetical protein
MTSAELFVWVRQIIDETSALAAAADAAALDSALRISRAGASARQDAADVARLREQIARSQRAVLRTGAW